MTNVEIRAWLLSNTHLTMPDSTAPIEELRELYQRHRHRGQRRLPPGEREENRAERAAGGTFVHSTGEVSTGQAGAA